MNKNYAVTIMTEYDSVSFTFDAAHVWMNKTDQGAEIGLSGWNSGGLLTFYNHVQLWENDTLIADSEEL
jgi:hypothetical protein